MLRDLAGAEAIVGLGRCALPRRFEMLLILGFAGALGAIIFGGEALGVGSHWQIFASCFVTSWVAVRVVAATDPVRQNDRIFDLERAVYVLKTRAGLGDDFDDFGNFDSTAFKEWLEGRRVVRGPEDEEARQKAGSGKASKT